MCWLRQRDTYPATVVAPLSKGDAAAVTLIPLCWRSVVSIRIGMPNAGAVKDVYTLVYTTLMR